MNWPETITIKYWKKGLSPHVVYCEFDYSDIGEYPRADLIQAVEAFKERNKTPLYKHLPYFLIPIIKFKSDEPFYIDLVMNETLLNSILYPMAKQRTPWLIFEANGEPILVSVKYFSSALYHKEEYIIFNYINEHYGGKFRIFRHWLPAKNYPFVFSNIVRLVYFFRRLF